MSTLTKTGLPLDDLESLWTALAEHITEVGEDREAIFLTKLALLMANEIGDYNRVLTCIEAAAVQSHPTAS